MWFKNFQRWNNKARAQQRIHDLKIAHGRLTRQTPTVTSATSTRRQVHWSHCREFWRLTSATLKPLGLQRVVLSLPVWGSIVLPWTQVRIHPPFGDVIPWWPTHLILHIKAVSDVGKRIWAKQALYVLWKSSLWKNLLFQKIPQVG